MTKRRIRLWWKLTGVVIGLVYVIFSLRLSIWATSIDKTSSTALYAPPRKPAVHIHPSQNKNVFLDPLNQTELLNLFDASSFPIIRTKRDDRPVRIRILLFEHQKRNIVFREGPTWAISDELLNICSDGFERSPNFELLGTTIVPDFNLQPDFVLPEDEDVVWVVDMRRTVLGQQYTISRQLVHLTNATLHYQRQQHTQTLPKIQVVLMDYRDRISAATLCTKGVREVIQLLGGESGVVRSVLRQVVRGRHWSDRLNFIVPGKVWDSRRDAACFGAPTLHVPYTVRSDYAEAVQKNYPFFLPNTTASRRHPTPVDTVRPIDVAHFWGIRDRPEGHAKLRDRVTKLIQSLGGEIEVNDGLAAGKSQTQSDADHWKVIADFVSAAAKEGRTQVSSDYVEALLTTKIVVVAQRDDWEDHYRLFEAVIGGAMVMTDPMALPEGLVDKENIIVYHSLDHLKELLRYYLDLKNENERLAIARKGWEVAMSRHRTYHWMEQLFFGHRMSV
jgi:hypothetical protein